MNAAVVESFGASPHFGSFTDPVAGDADYDASMSQLEQVTATQPSVAISRDRSRAIFGQTMGLVPLTCAVAALGA